MKIITSSSIIILFFTGIVNADTTATKKISLKSAQEELGKQLYFDPNLSKNRTQSCATCHDPNNGFVDKRDSGVKAAVSLGDDGQSLGDRSAPTASYAKYTPNFYFDKKKNKYIGGQFWDGRESNLEGQAGGPPLNPIEMGMPDKQSVVKRIIENQQYMGAFKEIYGESIFENYDKAYTAMTESIAAFEKTSYFSPFDSKYDRYLKGEYEMTEQEELGKSLFFSNNNTNCSTCHALKNEGYKQETFTNYEFHNIGVPVNTLVRSKNGLGKAHIEHGLLNNPLVSDVEHDGKFKVPTLRNVAVTAPYMHNGIFNDLRTVIIFYDKFNNPESNINPESNKPWATAEVEKTINKKDLKMKKLTEKKIDALVAFLKTLTDKRYEGLIN
ncbi:MAG: c-type cytochrome [Gammaproteobacteria bacterium]|nr:c-type cytochrome [Gammaproteobacteria bacterium]